MSFILSAKYQVMPNDAVAVAPGLGFGYCQISTATDTVTFVDLYANLHISKRIAIIGVYAVPRVVWSLTQEVIRYGSVFGILLGKPNFGLMGEFGYYLSTKGNPVTFMGAALCFPIPTFF